MRAGREGHGVSPARTFRRVRIQGPHENVCRLPRARGQTMQHSLSLQDKSQYVSVCYRNKML